MTNDTYLRIRRHFQARYGARWREAMAARREGRDPNCGGAGAAGEHHAPGNSPVEAAPSQRLLFKKNPQRQETTA